MTKFNQQTLLETHLTKTQEPNDLTCIKKIELKRRRRKDVNTCVPIRQVHVGQKVGFTSNQRKKKKKKEC